MFSRTSTLILRVVGVGVVVVIFAVSTAWVAAQGFIPCEDLFAITENIPSYKKYYVDKPELETGRMMTDPDGSAECVYPMYKPRSTETPTPPPSTDIGEPPTTQPKNGTGSILIQNFQQQQLEQQRRKLEKLTRTWVKTVRSPRPHVTLPKRVTTEERKKWGQVIQGKTWEKIQSKQCAPRPLACCTKGSSGKASIPMDPRFAKELGTFLQNIDIHQHDNAALKKDFVTLGVKVCGAAAYFVYDPQAELVSKIETMRRNIVRSILPPNVEIKVGKGSVGFSYTPPSKKDCGQQRWDLTIGPDTGGRITGNSKTVVGQLQWSCSF